MSENKHAELISQLEERTRLKKAGKAYKAIYDVWEIPDLRITRWKFNEYDYYSAEKVKLPITARGLYTLEDRIIVRGYDKFFNKNEVKTTRPGYLKDQTAGPYYATVKENGCLVLISGYKGKLLVTSKNSSGPSSTFNGRNHSLTARNWVLKHLEGAQKSEKEFADLLESNDWTAVGEVCDDSFEEHVLPYNTDAAGIYLNGLNHNEIVFATEPPAKVNEVSREFGFRQTDFVEFPTFEKLAEFLENGSATGKWNDREVEGFVIRCKHKESQLDFFWKYKFEEPYLMYREWREVVRSLLDDGIEKAIARARRSRHAQSCLKFLRFAEGFLREHEEFKKRLSTQNLGIIDLRTKFFEAAELNEQALLGLDSLKPKFLFVTVATLGCGKSTVARALVNLMKSQWGHRQNDLVQGKGKKFELLRSAISEDLFSKDAVILDKNNSERSERQRIFDEFDKVGQIMGFDIRYICLNFLPQGPSTETNKLTRQRVYARGDNHGTVKMSLLNEKGINGVMKNFESRFQVVNTNLPPDSQFDSVIDLKAGESLHNVLYVLNQVRQKYGDNLAVPEFTDEQILEAIEQAMAPHDAELSSVQASKGKQKKEKQQKQNSDTEKGKTENKPSARSVKINYFGIAIDEENYKTLVGLAHKLLADAPNGDWIKQIRVQKEFHVTLSHRSSHKDLFEKMFARFQSQITKPGKNALDSAQDLEVVGIAWSPEVIAFDVRTVGSGNERPHITVGTAQGIPAKEASKLLSTEKEHYKKLIEPIRIKNQRLFASP